MLSLFTEASLVTDEDSDRDSLDLDDLLREAEVRLYKLAVTVKTSKTLDAWNNCCNYILNLVLPYTSVSKT